MDFLKKELEEEMKENEEIEIIIRNNPEMFLDISSDEHDQSMSVNLNMNTYTKTNRNMDIDMDMNINKLQLQLQPLLQHTKENEFKMEFLSQEARKELRGTTRKANRSKNRN